MNDNTFTLSHIQNALDWAYDKALNGIAGLDSARELADSYLSESDNLLDNVNALIRWQNAKAGASGFLTGLGGMITLPVAIPANITSIIFIQVRMAAAIAYMGGHDPRDEKVKTFIYLCLCGNVAKDILKGIGIKITGTVLNKLSAEMVNSISRSVSTRFLSQLGQRSSVNLVKFIPFAGGLVGGLFDSVSTNIVGNIARDIFIQSEINLMLIQNK